MSQVTKRSGSILSKKCPRCDAATGRLCREKDGSVSKRDHKERATRKYVVTAQITVHTLVRATSAKAAERIAADRGVMTLCHQCSGSETSREEWVTDGLDGEPSGLSAEEQR